MSFFSLELHMFVSEISDHRAAKIPISAPEAVDNGIWQVGSTSGLSLTSGIL